MLSESDLGAAQKMRLARASSRVRIVNDAALVTVVYFVHSLRMSMRPMLSETRKEDACITLAGRLDFLAQERLFLRA